MSGTSADRRKLGEASLSEGCLWVVLLSRQYFLDLEGAVTASHGRVSLIHRLDHNYLGGFDFAFVNALF